MLNIALAIQNTLYQNRSTKLQQTAQYNYIQHINDVSHSIQFDRIKVLLKQYSAYLSKLKLNFKIDQPCFWLPTNIAPKYSLRELADEMDQLDASIKSEIYSCHKKIYRRYRRRNNRVRAHSY